MVTEELRSLLFWNHVSGPSPLSAPDAGTERRGFRAGLGDHAGDGPDVGADVLDLDPFTPWTRRRSWTGIDVTVSELVETVPGWRRSTLDRRRIVRHTSDGADHEVAGIGDLDRGEFGRSEQSSPGT